MKRAASIRSHPRQRPAHSALLPKLRVFVASSSEELATARTAAKALETPRLEVHVWDKDIFEFSATYIESLERELDRADFAVVIMTGNDVARVRRREVNLPRDNVIFELGLFLGRLGRERTFFLVSKRSRTKIASDLSGVEPVVFESAAHLREGMAALREQMLPSGVRYKPSADVRQKQAELWRFSSDVAGHWWERMRKGEDDKSALSFVAIDVDEVTNALKLRGATYGRKGEPLATWETITTGLVLGPQPKLFYHWEGEQDATQAQTYGGGGAVWFESLQSGYGYIYDTNLALIQQGAPTYIKHFRIYRCDPTEVAIMSTAWTAKADSLIKRKLRELKG